MRIVQFLDEDNNLKVGLVTNESLLIVDKAESVYKLAVEAIESDVSIKKLITERVSGIAVYYNQVIRENRLLTPISHPDPYHTVVAGTGLTHLGSANSRDSMHAKIQETENPTDSMKMFKMGLDEGKPARGDIGVQPEWFYKGNGFCIVPPGHAIKNPSFALDLGDEAEVCGIYVNSKKGIPNRVGFALGNEFSDHKTEKTNYLWLAHSKLRQCSIGPELLLDDLPDDISGTSRIIRDNKTLWEESFSTGETNMSHSISNLEYHHFKYELFRKPNMLNIHFFGTSTLSFSKGIATKENDIFEIESPVFGKPLRNRLKTTATESVIHTCY